MSTVSLQKDTRSPSKAEIFLNDKEMKEKEACPLCNETFELIELISHVETCEGNVSDEEDTDLKLARQLQDEEDQKQRERNSKTKCQKCQKQIQVEDIYILDDCGHKFCRECLKEHVTSTLYKTATIVCPTKDCKAQLSVRDVKEFSPNYSSDKKSMFKSQASGTATERLMSELKQIMNSDSEKNGFTAEPIDDNLYQWEICLFNFDSPMKEDMKQLGMDHVTMHAVFPKSYPFTPPYIRVIEPRFAFRTGHITIGGSICFELLTLSHWTPVLRYGIVFVALTTIIFTRLNPLSKPLPRRYLLLCDTFCLSYTEETATSSLNRNTGSRARADIPQTQLSHNIIRNETRQRTTHESHKLLKLTMRNAIALLLIALSATSVWADTCQSGYSWCSGVNACYDPSQYDCVSDQYNGQNRLCAVGTFSCNDVCIASCAYQSGTDGGYTIKTDRTCPAPPACVNDHTIACGDACYDKTKFCCVSALATKPITFTLPSSSDQLPAATTYIPPTSTIPLTTAPCIPGGVTISVPFTYYSFDSGIVNGLLKDDSGRGRYATLLGLPKSIEGKTKLGLSFNSSQGLQGLRMDQTAGLDGDFSIATYNFKGALDDFLLFNQTLSAQHILSIISNRFSTTTLPPTPTTKIAGKKCGLPWLYWSFDKIKLAKCIDDSGHGRHGSFSTDFSLVAGKLRQALNANNNTASSSLSLLTFDGNAKTVSFQSSLGSSVSWNATSLRADAWVHVAVAVGVDRVNEGVWTRPSMSSLNHLVRDDGRFHRVELATSMDPALVKKQKVNKDSQQSILDVLPPELLSHVLQFLRCRDLCRVAQVGVLKIMGMTGETFREETDSVLDITRMGIRKQPRSALGGRVQTSLGGEPREGTHWRVLPEDWSSIFTTNWKRLEMDGQDSDDQFGAVGFSVNTSERETRYYFGEFDVTNKHQAGLGYHWTSNVDNFYYIGEFDKGERCGSGMTISTTQWIQEQKKRVMDNHKLVIVEIEYDGEWLKDQRHGQGTYRWPNGDVYTGEFSHHFRDGCGVYRWSTNDCYRGNFKKNIKNGSGTFFFSNGDVFEGHYVDGKRSGLGKYIWPHGDHFEGEYLHDNRHGFGVYKYAHGGRYEGYYAHDTRHGMGSFVWPDGDVYNGEWKAESRVGRGTLTRMDGSVHEQEWNESHKANYSFAPPDKFPYNVCEVVTSSSARK
ncbi:hypothetical protein PROFUN_06488 [Planoprotostelium fungivorum]|uniref:Uncharacterized protein n=1 Tax=Planoprotostelium fungivorum TaxID=1890364 RepID=A0A2P6NNY1_9EUKA|nr:hypothetical protein PROFUN_06488 [Planoprotostelium fungivorum]